jgi:hypothetical protein
VALLVCPYCKSHVEPWTDAEGRRVCPNCRNTGQATGAAPGATATPTTQAQPTAEGATASMVLGILGIVIPYVGFILAIIAIVLGSKALRLIADSGGRLQGQGMAKAGQILGIVSLCLYGVVLVIVLMFVAAFSTAGFN